MEKSLVVQGKSLEDALDKAALLLHWPKERIAYEILQEPTPGRYGQSGVPCKLRVTPVSPAAEELAPDNPRMQEAEQRLPGAERDLEVMPSPVFLLSLQNLVSLVPRVSLFPDPTPMPPTQQEPREIIGDVNLGSGPLCHDGDVRIHGHVRKGLRVQAAGSIHVLGDVETAFLDAGGDIVLTGGLLGTARSRAGSIACRFAQGARLDAPQGDIAIRESAMHAHIRAGRSVTVGDILLGGSCYAEGLIEVRIAGSDSGVPTTLIAGPNKRLYEEVEAIRDRAQRTIAELRENDALCRALLPQEEAGAALPVSDRLRLWRALAAKARAGDALMQMSRQKSRLLGMINADHTARVCVTGRAYPRVKVIVDDQAQDLRDVIQYATFSKDYEAGELRITPYR